MPDLLIEDLVIPPVGEMTPELAACIQISRDARAEFFGTRDNQHSDEGYRSTWSGSEFQDHVTAVGTVDGEVVGFYALSFPLQDNLHMAYTSVRVAAEHRGHGYGTALAAAMHVRAARPGRTTLLASTFHTAEQTAAAPETLSPASGSGRIPTDDPGVHLARSTGYDLGLVNQVSVSLIRDVDLAALRAQAEAKAGDEYTVVQWHGPTRVQHLDEVAKLYNRMSVDVPAGGIDFAEESWTAESIAAMERVVESEGREQWVTAIDFAGTLIAFSVLYTEEGADRTAEQEETLVFSEHRGRALGQLVKAANAQFLLEHKPEVERIFTWNAAENTHMLAINAVIGFRPLGASGNWQKVV